MIEGLNAEKEARIKRGDRLSQAIETLNDNFII